MKRICLYLLSLLLSYASGAQNKMFLRVYNTEGRKMSKGYFVNASDTSLMVYRGSRTKEIPISRVGYVKTRRSVAHTLAAGTFVAAVPLGIMLVSRHEKSEITPAKTPSSRKNAATANGQQPPNSLAKRTVYKINGDIFTWKVQKETIDLLPRLQ